MNVLIIDDEPEYRTLLGHYLESEGHNVFLAEHGEDGLKKLDDAQMDIIICDVYMPYMDGLKFHKTIRNIERFKNIPILFVSGFDDPYTLSAVLTSKLNGFIRKARPLTELIAWIKYLTTPIDQRPLNPPTELPFKTTKSRDRDRSLRANR